MQEVFEKIKQKLKELNLDGLVMLEDDKYELVRKKEAIEIVDEVAEEYNKKYEPTIDLLEYGIDGYNMHLKEQYNKGYEDGLNADKWIPCSERLPNEYGEYLYTDINDEVHEGCFAPYDGVLIGGWSTCHADGVVRLSDDKVIAWKPLPKPYKKEV